ncbi:MAG: DNA mismatch repair protein MutS [Chloroflexi bacterium]|nr:DNA mismatch repair protein MutS [Chloroflexota bacterium]
MAKSEASLTPVRRQYLRIKQRYPEAIVLFRLGDFYETFDEDARLVSRLLEITLTSREMGKGQRFPMAGIPHHALNNYLARLINRGHKVAICEQLSPPGKGLVERDVVRVVTPGTVVEPSLLQGNANNYLASVISDGEMAGLAYVDITTAEFVTAQISLERLPPELERLQPAETLIPKEGEPAAPGLPGIQTPVDEYWFELDTARQSLLEHFGVATLEGYGCADLPLAIRAAGAIIRYLQENQKGALPLLTQLRTYSTEAYMLLDAQTRRNLELFQGSRQGTAAGSLLSVIGLTQTPMGGRLLRRWLGHPLLDLTQLTERQESIERFRGHNIVRGNVIALLRHIGDLERLINRVRGGQANPKELVALRRHLAVIPQIRAAVAETGAPESWLTGLQACDEVAALISRAIADDPPASLDQGGTVRPGFSPELDELRSASREAKQYLANLERQEKERTGIKSLKVGYNRVFGYYIEVSHANRDSVPGDYIRKQTLTTAERFYTVDLKEYESLILNAQERMAEMESAVFRQVCQQVAGWGEQILAVADALAHLDAFTSLAEVAVRYGYCRPGLDDGDVITIKGGRHPVVERYLDGNGFIPNDTYLGNKDSQIIILTGPNMSGKSTYLRQVALIVLLAQMGSFVPADSASIGLVDRIFTRIGAQEDLAAGQSTFMVEMVETANILNNATSRSLIILDEIGRGTSTYDGLSIAHAVVEHIHSHPRLGAKTLFATHYHELVELAGYLPRVKNCNVAVAEEGGKVVFLRKVIPGGADRSYGIHVAQLAGLPRSVLRRAGEVLAELENGRHPQTPSGRRGPRARAPQPVPEQIPLFGRRPPLIDELRQLDPDSLSPLEALNKLYELHKKAEDS